MQADWEIGLVTPLALSGKMPRSDGHEFLDGGGVGLGPSKALERPLYHSDMVPVWSWAELLKASLLTLEQR